MRQGCKQPSLPIAGYRMYRGHVNTPTWLLCPQSSHTLVNIHAGQCQPVLTPAQHPSVNMSEEGEGGISCISAFVKPLLPQGLPRSSWFLCLSWWPCSGWGKGPSFVSLHESYSHERVLTSVTHFATSGFSPLYSRWRGSHSFLYGETKTHQGNCVQMVQPKGSQLGFVVVGKTSVTHICIHKLCFINASRQYFGCRVRGQRV